MDCEEITKVPVANAILQTRGDTRLEKLFNCIYLLYHKSFLNWILNKYSNKSVIKDKLLEDAKDAFENGILTLYLKAGKNELNLKGSLKTTVYSFGLLQLLASFKKDRSVYGAGDYIDCLDLLLETPSDTNERFAFFSEREKDLMEALTNLPQKQREILIMKFFYKLKSKQIAEILNVTPGNVDNDSAKAYKKLRKILISKSSFQNQPNGIDRSTI